MENEAEIAGNYIYNSGWSQGSYVECKNLNNKYHNEFRAYSPGFKEKIAEQLSSSKTIIVLLSQPCDILAHCKNEPVIELVIAKKISKKPHPQNCNARSSRFLEFNIEGKWYKATTEKICCILKEDFKEIIIREKIKPLQQSKQNVEVLTWWRANRYRRQALPNKFVEYISPLLKDRQNLLEELEVAAIFLCLDPWGESDNYKVRLFALESKEAFPSEYDKLHDKMEALLTEINLIPGLECPYLSNSEDESFPFDEILPVMRRNEITIRQKDEFIKWNFDYISLAGDDYENMEEE